MCDVQFAGVLIPLRCSWVKSFVPSTWILNDTHISRLLTATPNFHHISSSPFSPRRADWRHRWRTNTHSSHTWFLFSGFCLWTNKEAAESERRQQQLKRDQWMIEQRPVYASNVDRIMVSNTFTHPFSLPKLKTRHSSRIENTTQVVACDGQTGPHGPGGCRNPFFFGRHFLFDTHKSVES